MTIWKHYLLMTVFFYHSQNFLTSSGRILTNLDLKSVTRPDNSHMRYDSIDPKGYPMQRDHCEIYSKDDHWIFTLKTSFLTKGIALVTTGGMPGVGEITVTKSDGTKVFCYDYCLDYMQTDKIEVTTFYGVYFCQLNVNVETVQQPVSPSNTTFALPHFMTFGRLFTPDDVKTFTHCDTQSDARPPHKLNTDFPFARLNNLDTDCFEYSGWRKCLDLRFKKKEMIKGLVVFTRLDQGLILTTWESRMPHPEVKLIDYDTKRAESCENRYCTNFMYTDHIRIEQMKMLCRVLIILVPSLTTTPLPPVSANTTSTINTTTTQPSITNGTSTLPSTTRTSTTQLLANTTTTIFPTISANTTSTIPTTTSQPSNTTGTSILPNTTTTIFPTISGNTTSTIPTTTSQPSNTTGTSILQTTTNGTTTIRGPTLPSLTTTPLPPANTTSTIPTNTSQPSNTTGTSTLRQMIF